MRWMACLAYLELTMRLDAILTSAERSAVTVGPSFQFGEVSSTTVLSDSIFDIAGMGFSTMYAGSTTDTGRICLPNPRLLPPVRVEVGIFLRVVDRQAELGKPLASPSCMVVERPAWLNRQPGFTIRGPVHSKAAISR